MTDEIIGFKPELPNNGWPFIREAEDGYMFLSNGLSVIISGQIEEGIKWLHVSLARRARMPSYEDITLVRSAFIPDSLKAIMIFPTKKYYVNIHPFCLHLWACLDTDPLPEFSHGLGTI